jgi:Xaa-Pro dipeptidase
MAVPRRGFLRLAGGSALGGLTLGYDSLVAVARGEAHPSGLGLAVATMPRSGKPFRMTEAWYRRQVKALQQKLGERGLRGIVLEDAQNFDYLVGLFLTKTERPAWVWVPTEGEPALFGPGLDKDMFREWWIKDFQWYFCYPHAGPFNQVVFDKGPRVDLTAWMLQEVAKRGGASGRVGLEKEATPSQRKQIAAVLPEMEPVAAGDLLLDMRIRKTPEEIALVQVAIDYHDKTLQYARDLIAEKGLALLDSDVRRASQKYAEDLVFSEYEATGRSHEAVGFNLGLGCRAGVATAYPHPNQYFHKRIARGDAVQIAGITRIGGYGGEGYRALHVEPIPPLARKLWEVNLEMVLAQTEHSKPGVACREVAEKVLGIAKKAGVERYVYHRPAHGQGMEGHQPPYIALGDETVLQEGMMFSNEPGLFNLEDGYGYNVSNNVLITKDGARRMNECPMTKEFSWLRL